MRWGFIVVGGVLLGFGLVALLSASGESTVSFMPYVGTVAGALTILGGLLSSRPQTEARYGGPTLPQMVGRPCVDCGKKILTALDAAPCSICFWPVHGDCTGAHHARAHRSAAPAGYR